MDQPDNKRRLKRIEREFRSRKSRNPRYSLTKFSADAGITQAYASMLFKGKRNLSLDLYLKVCRNLNLDPQLSGPVPKGPAKPKPSKQAGTGQYDSPQFKKVQVIRGTGQFEWYDLMIADLVALPKFKPDIGWIASQLDIPLKKVLDSIERLIRLGFIIQSGESYKRSHVNFHFDTSESVDFIRSYHRNLIQKALSELERTDQEDFESRYVSGASFTVNRKVVPALRKKAERFIQEAMDQFSTTKDANSLYQINIQLFPLVR